MNNEQLLSDFFRALRVTLTNAFSYSKDHPYFLKSSQELTLKLDLVLHTINPFIIGVTDTALVAGGKTWQQAGLHDELARIMHQRKIKSIKILPGFNTDELIQFLFTVSMSQKDILKAGGITQIVSFKNFKHFQIEELDYSSLLQEKGQGNLDIWGSLLKEVSDNEDLSKVEGLVNNFSQVLKKINQEEFFSNSGIAQTLKDFLIYLKSKDISKFNKCIRDIFFWLLQNKSSLSDEKLSKVRDIFGNLSKEDFSALLWEGLLNEEQFDNLSLQLFAKISDKNRQKEFADNLFQMISDSGVLKNNPKVVKKIQELFASPQNNSVSLVYRNTLNYLSKDMVCSGAIIFDRTKLKTNFRYILLSLLSYDYDTELKQSGFILENLDKEIDSAIKDKDLVYLKDLWAFFLNKQKITPGVFAAQESKISIFVEELLFAGALPEEFKDLSDWVKTSSKPYEFYLGKIFSANTFDPLVLKWFLRLANQDLGMFYKQLDSRRANVDFLEKIIAALSACGTYLAAQPLKYIYNFSNSLIKLEALKAMRSLPNPDYQFLYSTFSVDAPEIRKEALAIISISVQERTRAIEALFNTAWGMDKRKRITLENMRIIWELDLKEAIQQLTLLSKKKFFWNRQIRQNAFSIIRGWNAG
ncbi:MAG: hypothetical protein M0Q96_01765 [Candidatus Omnitrophica bacterium]|nr:hypothetical protein [Candidatus Omnitrophota bacterium]